MQNLGTYEYSSLLSKWWNSIDKSLFTAYIMLIAIGIILIGVASPVAASRIHNPIIGTYSLLHKHMIFLIPAVPLTFIVSILNPRFLRFFALLLLGASLLGLVLTELIGVEIKGSQRWLIIAGFSLQSSEFVKPAFAFVCAWLFSTQRNSEQAAFFGWLGWFVGAGIALFLVIVSLLAMQSDFGQSLLISATFFSLLFIIGIGWWWVSGFIAVVVGVLLLIVYPFIGYFSTRLQSHFSDNKSYQVEKSLQAFRSGGITGQGPTEGWAKYAVPDSHTDFIFSVAAEEFGFIGCALILGLFIFIFARVMWLVLKQNNHFIICCSLALTVQLSAQTFINIGSSLGLIPTTGMTLPLISYGGSSFLAVSIAFGLLLNLTRKRM